MIKKKEKVFLEVNKIYIFLKIVQYEKDVYVSSFHIAEHHFTVRFNIFDESIPFTLEKDKKLNKDKIKKKITESSKNWKSTLSSHFNEIIAYILNKC